MKIGITYDLRADYLAEGYAEEQTAEFDRPDTIEAIAGALASIGHQPDRIGNIRSLVARLASGQRWDLVFNIAEGLHGFAREAQIPALLEAYDIPYTFSDPLTLSLALHKGMAKHVVRDQGIPTADFAVVEDPADIGKIALPFPLFVKPVAEGTGKGVTERSKVYAPPELRAVCSELLQSYRQPVLVETYLAGREFTVGVVGTGRTAASVGILEIVLLDNAEKDVYSYVNKEKCEELVEYRLVNDTEALAAERVALDAWRALRCRDGGRLDIRSDGRGVPHFIEVNPLAGLHPHHSDLPIICSKAGIPYGELIRRILDAAISRVR